MMRTVEYADKDERTRLIAEAEAAGERMVHDDYLDATGQHGALTFEVHTPQLSDAENRRLALEALPSLTHDQLVELLRIRGII